MDASTWFRVTAVVERTRGDRSGDGPADPAGDRSAGDVERPDLRHAEVIADLVVDALWQAGTPAVEEQETTASRTFLAGYPSEEAADAAAAAARRAGADSVEVGSILDDGLDGWRAHAAPHRTGPFTVVPPWLDAPATPGSRPLVIDPGRSFGSGSHPTSRLVLAALEPLVTRSTTALDVGCGSGILAIGSVLLGAASAHGIDVDPDAPAVTLANAAANGVADRVTASDEPLGAVAASGRRFEVVAANLLAPILVELAEPLRTVVAPGGTLVVSGLLADRWRSTVDVLTAGSDLVAAEPTREGDWVAVALGRPHP